MARSTSARSPEAFKLLVAHNLRRLRSERGLSLEQVSSLSDVSRAMLSQVETGKTTPTIAVLWKIATGLGVPFTEFLREETAAPISVKRRDELTVLYSSDRHFRSTPVLGSAGAATGVELYRITLDAGQASRSTAHAPGTMEVVVVERGRLEVNVLGVTAELGEGDVATFAADVDHSYRALGRSACVFYDVVRYGGAQAPVPAPASSPPQRSSGGSGPAAASGRRANRGPRER